MKAFLLTALFVVAASAVSIAKAAECPITTFDGDYTQKVIDAVTAEKTCESASAVAESCAMGSTLDVQITSPALTKCEADFKAVIKKSAVLESTYTRLQKRCGDKYAKAEGTMYRSANSFCSLNVSRLFSELYGPQETF